MNATSGDQVGSNDHNSSGPADPEDTSKCGMCNLMVGDEGIGCDRCTAWFHPSEICMGLSQNSIHVIVESEDSKALLYLCTSCRLKPGTGTWTRSKQRNSNKKDEEKDQLVSQLFQTVKGLCSEVAKLTQKINLVFPQGQQTSQTSGGPSGPSEGGRSYSEVASGPPVPTQVQSGTTQPSQMQASQSDSQYRTLVRQEVREIQEREKRRSSLVIRGLSSTTAAQVVSEFGDITSTMMGSRVTLTDVVKIPNNSELWRAKLMDADQRKFVLDNAKRLKGSQYDHIYVRRDLTYAQRMELKQRREAQAPPSGGTPERTNRVSPRTAPDADQSGSDVPRAPAANTSRDNPGPDTGSTPTDTADTDSRDSVSQGTETRSTGAQQGSGTQNTRDTQSDITQSN